MHSVEAFCVQSSTQPSRLPEQTDAVSVPFWSVKHIKVTVPNVKFFNFQVIQVFHCYIFTETKGNKNAANHQKAIHSTAPSFFCPVSLRVKFIYLNLKGPLLI